LNLTSPKTNIQAFLKFYLNKDLTLVSNNVNHFLELKNLKITLSSHHKVLMDLSRQFAKLMWNAKITGKAK